MSRRNWVAAACGSVVAAALVWALFRSSGLSAAHVGRLLINLRPAPVAALFGLTCLHILLAAEKWRLVEERLAGRKPSMRSAFAFSATGTALGQLLPIQLANALSRGLGNKYGRGAHGGRGAAASLWEQSFDLYVMLLLVAPTLLITVIGDTQLFAPVAIAGMLVGAASLPLGRIGADLLGRAPVERVGRAGRWLTASGLLAPDLTLRLYTLSVGRFLVLWLMSVAVRDAAGSPIPAVDLAVALPVAVLASVISMLPAGVGATEWSFAAVLTALGNPIADSVGWTLVNRVLIAQAALVIGLLSVPLLARRPFRRAIEA